MYKILTGREEVDPTRLCQFASREIKFTWTSLEVVQETVSSQRLKKYFFSQRIISLCNSLPNSVVTAPSVNSFKKRLDDYVADMDNS